MEILVLHNKVDELNPVRRGSSAAYELAECLRGSLPIQSHRRPDEDTQAMTLHPGFVDELRRATGLDQHALQFA